MIVDLRSYEAELRHWITAFEDYVELASNPALKRVLRDLETGRVERDSFRWHTTKPIKSKVANRYDGVAKDAHEVVLSWEFTCSFTKRKPIAKKEILWDVSELSTQTKVLDAASDETILHFHQDLKNKDQFGPHCHLQIAERYIEDVKGVRLATPRFPAAAILPTDCFDLVLSEFFPHEWPESQSRMTGIATVRERQLKRAADYITALHGEVRKRTLRTPFAVLQNCHMPDLRLT